MKEREIKRLLLQDGGNRMVYRRLSKQFATESRIR